MTSARYIIGDTRDVVASMPDGSVDLIMTSPPFLALRSYLPADHPDKHREIGSEPDPAGFVDTLLELTAEWGRVLAPHGSICVELGDTYSGSGGSGGDYNEGGLRDGQAKFSGSASRNGKDLGHASKDRYASSDKRPGWPLAKSACLIPELYRVALAYGINPITGKASPAGRWRVRNTVRWCRPNPPVGALGDKFRPATSDMVIACRSDKRWFDLDAVRNGNYDPENDRDRPDYLREGTREQERVKVGLSSGAGWKGLNPAGAPPLDYWVIPTHPYKGSHYATYPPELCRIPIEAMCPRQVCTTCGEPRRRIVGEAEYVKPDGSVHQMHGDGFADDTGTLANRRKVTGHDNGNMTRVAPTLGWTDCGHDTWRPGIVLDPFGGSGTTAAVATGHGRDAICIDMDERNADLAQQRIGMFCTVEHHEGAPA